MNARFRRLWHSFARKQRTAAFGPPAKSFVKREAIWRMAFLEARAALLGANARFCLKTKNSRCSLEQYIPKYLENRVDEVSY